MTQFDLNAWLSVGMVLLFVIVCAAVVLVVFIRLQRKYWFKSKTPFWFEALRMAVTINTGIFSAKWAELYLLPILN